MKPIRKMCLLATCVLFLAQAAPVLSEDRLPISRDEAAKIAQEHFDGKLLDIRPRGKEYKGDYRVKMLREGRVRVFSIDGKTGKIEE